MKWLKVGDLGRVIGPSNIGLSKYGVNVLGNVLEIIRVDHDDEDATYLAALPEEMHLSAWFPKGSLEPAEESKKEETTPKTETQPMVVNINIGSELTNITIGGKRFRLVPEA